MHEHAACTLNCSGDGSIRWILVSCRRHDLFRNTFELSPDHMGVSGAEIDAKFNMADSYNGNYTFRVRGPGLMGPYLEETALPAAGDGTERSHTNDDVTPGPRSYLSGGGGWIVGLKAGKEYWVEVDADPMVQSDVQQVIDIATNEIVRLNVPSSYGSSIDDCSTARTSATIAHAPHREVALTVDDRV
eukprot:m.620643 g.620643  ORF g.620643 m.620643 type:complete len:188 (+) comp22537_c1_seq2:293-856(+)